MPNRASIWPRWEHIQAGVLSSFQSGTFGWQFSSPGVQAGFRGCVSGTSTGVWEGATSCGLWLGCNGVRTALSLRGLGGLGVSGLGVSDLTCCDDGISELVSNKSEKSILSGIICSLTE